jgi:hypothetical protein
LFEKPYFKSGTIGSSGSRVNPNCFPKIIPLTPFPEPFI